MYQINDFPFLGFQSVATKVLLYYPIIIIPIVLTYALAKIAGCFVSTKIKRYG